MGKGNCKRNKKVSFVVSGTLNIGMLLVTAATVVIFRQVASSNLRQLSEEQGAKERILRQLNDKYERKASDWQMDKTEANIQRVLVSLGLEMREPSPNNCIHMGVNGLPVPGQTSVRRARERLAQMGETLPSYEKAVRKKKRHRD